MCTQEKHLCIRDSYIYTPGVIFILSAWIISFNQNIYFEEGWIYFFGKCSIPYSFSEPRKLFNPMYTVLNSVLRDTSFVTESHGSVQHSHKQSFFSSLSSVTMHSKAESGCQWMYRTKLLMKVATIRTSPIYTVFSRFVYRTPIKHLAKTSNFNIFHVVLYFVLYITLWRLQRNFPILFF